MPFCTTCGANVDGAFCARCGTPVGATPAAPPPVQPGSAMTPPPLPGPVPRRGMHPLLLAAIIIFGLIFVCILGFVGFGIYAARAFRNNPGAVIAKIITAANPNVEVVSTDNAAGTITIRDRRNGKESTITFEQARNGGHFSITANGDDGGHATVQFGGGQKLDIPAWVPRYPGAAENGTFSAQGSSRDGSGEGGSFNFTTPDSARKVLDYYETQAQGAGLKINLNSATGSGGTLVAADEGRKRSLTVVVGGGASLTTVNVTYASKE